MKLSKTALSLTLFTHFIFADQIFTTNGDELSGTIVEQTDQMVRYIPDSAIDSTVITVNISSLFMVKYSDGRKVVFSKANTTPKPFDLSRRWSGSCMVKGGVFGLINVDERYFDADIITLGIAPAIEYRINRIVAVGVEYMALWVQPNTDNEARFIMNCNGLGKLIFPINEKLAFRSQIGLGVSIWPGAKDTLVQEPTFYDDRIGWDVQLDFGLEHRLSEKWSLLANIGYQASFSDLDTIAITMDGMMLSAGPSFKF